MNAENTDKNSSKSDNKLDNKKTRKTVSRAKYLRDSEASSDWQELQSMDYDPVIDSLY